MNRKVKMIILSLALIFIILGGFFIFRLRTNSPGRIFIKNQDDTPETEVISEKGGEDLSKNIELAKPVETSGNEPTIDNKDDNPPQDDSKLSITKRLVSWGFASANNRTINTIIIHSSYNALGGDVYDLAKLIQEYQQYGVSPHYLIDRKGKIYQLVEDKNIAYHAGEGKTPDGRTSVNGFSLGIEIMNTEKEKPTSEQYASLKQLISNLKTKYSIKYTLGHNQIAPGRKTDPWNFDWEKIK